MASVEVHWHYTEGWWHEDPHQRAYYRIETRDGMRCIIYRDLLTDRWHMHQTLD